jgi:hypothetical protein
MEPRALSRIMQLPTRRRLDVIAEGLDLLAEHVLALRENIHDLAAHKRRRGVGVLTAHANEEAAKMLVLLDLVRLAWRDQKAANRQVGYFYSHLARWIYAEAAEMRPASFAEIRRLVEIWRASHYLDGPNDVDWVFRNELIARREESIYVDYVHHEDGDEWTTPRRFDEVQWGTPTPVLDLVGALHRLGCTSRRGLDVIAAAWKGQRITDQTHWQEVAALNRLVVENVREEGLASDDVSAGDVGAVVDSWTFPLSGLDLSEHEVSVADLEAERGRWSPW